MDLLRSFSDLGTQLVHIAEVLVFLVRQILKRVHHVLVPGLADARLSQRIPLLVLVHQVEPQADDDNDQQAVAAQMRRKRDEVTGLVPGEEDLGACNDKVSQLLTLNEGYYHMGVTYQSHCQWTR